MRRPLPYTYTCKFILVRNLTHTIALYLWWFHVEHFGDPALHDEEVRVIDVKLDRAKEVLHSRRRGIAAVDQILISTSNHNLEGGKVGVMTCHFKEQKT